MASIETLVDQVNAILGSQVLQKRVTHECLPDSVDIKLHEKCAPLMLELINKRIAAYAAKDIKDIIKREMSEDIKTHMPEVYFVNDLKEMKCDHSVDKPFLLFTVIGSTQYGYVPKIREGKMIDMVIRYQYPTNIMINEFTHMIQLTKKMSGIPDTSPQNVLQSMFGALAFKVTTVMT